MPTALRGGTFQLFSNNEQTQLGGTPLYFMHTLWSCTHKQSKSCKFGHGEDDSSLHKRVIWKGSLGKGFHYRNGSLGKGFHYPCGGIKYLLANIPSSFVCMCTPHTVYVVALVLFVLLCVCVCVNLCPLFLVALSRCTRKDWMVEMYQEDCDMDTKDKKGEGCYRRGDSLAHGKMFLVRDTCCCVLDLSLTIASISWDLSTNLQQYALAFHLFSQEAFHALRVNTRWNSSVFYGICWGLLSWNWC